MYLLFAAENCKCTGIKILSVQFTGLLNISLKVTKVNVSANKVVFKILSILSYHGSSILEGITTKSILMKQGA